MGAVLVPAGRRRRLERFRCHALVGFQKRQPVQHGGAQTGGGAGRDLQPDQPGEMAADIAHGNHASQRHGVEHIVRKLGNGPIVLPFIRQPVAHQIDRQRPIAAPREGRQNLVEKHPAERCDGQEHQYPLARAAILHMHETLRGIDEIAPRARRRSFAAHGQRRPIFMLMALVLR
jgi:hypothetical protein